MARGNVNVGHAHQTLSYTVAMLSRMQGSQQCTLHVVWIIKANQVKPNYRGATPGTGSSRTTNFHRFPTVYRGNKATTLHSRRSQPVGRL